jgi:DNA-binding response OmpR family regulator
LRAEARVLLERSTGTSVSQENLKNVLVVEDDPAIRRLVTMVLQRQGYQVETASDGIEAVLKLGLNDYAVIILDLMMPNLDGFTLMSTLAENDPSQLKRVIVTSAASPAVIRERMNGTPFALMPKPFDIKELVERVEACTRAQDPSSAMSASPPSELR